MPLAAAAAEATTATHPHLGLRVAAVLSVPLRPIGLVHLGHKVMQVEVPVVVAPTPLQVVVVARAV